MKIATALVVGASLLGFAVAGQAQQKDKEHAASPAAGTKQQEERTGAHSQPNTPGTSATDVSKEAKSDKPQASAPASSGQASASTGNKDEQFKALDVDGDGQVSKAEAAGHADVVTGFDRADRNKDGKLSRAEFERLGEKRSAKAATKQRKDAGASVGASDEPRSGTGGMRSATGR